MTNNENEEYITIKPYRPEPGGNQINYYKDGFLCVNVEMKGLNIKFNGDDNVVNIELPANFSNCAIVMDGNNNTFNLKSTKHRTIRNTTFGLEGGSTINVGSGLSVYRDTNIVAKNGKTITIGDECMFAREIMIRNNDGHVILDKKTGELLNPPEDIIIGNHVWIGMRVMIFKGAVIPDGSVVGAGSLVNKKFEEENILIAGSPAKKIRSDIEWRREDFAKYMDNNTK